MDIFNNGTFVKEFVLLGFEGYEDIRAILFTLFLVVYVITVFGNILIIGLVGAYRSLHSPMYIFLCNLSLSDIFITTNVVPNLLAIIIKGRKTISFLGCFTQVYFHGVLVTTECFFLTVMSYDRCLAFCKPLHYTRIMDSRLKIYISLVWISSLVIMFLAFMFLLQLSFCGSNIIDHFFCDLDPLLTISCSEISIIKTETFIASIFVMCLPFLCIIYSYVRILVTISRISTIHGRKKTFSTCSAHLLAVCTYFLTISSVYCNTSKGNSSNINKLESFLYIVGTPFFNPIIYALRNKEIHSALHKLRISLKCNCLWSNYI